jgi:hypothetical protein
MELFLPFPPKALSPNGSHGHWAAKSRPTKAYRTQCGWELIAGGLGKIKAESLGVVITFFPPRAGMDLDNCIRRFKAGQDAIADVTGINDRNFVVSYPPLAAPIRPDGMVKIELSWAETREAA